MSGDAPLVLTVRRFIAAAPLRLFQAWTTPSQLRSWWGPRGVRCTHAEVDVRPGGRYLIGNELPDGCVLWISGEFLRVEPPTELVYTWRVEPGAAALERVTVRFEASGSGTDVTVVHERIADQGTKEEHARGWDGCLERLAEHVSTATSD